MARPVERDRTQASVNCESSISPTCVRRAMTWLMISSFVVSDLIYIQLTESGMYDYVMSGVSFALLADTLYVVAYLLVAWGGLEQYLLLRSNAAHSQVDS